MAKRRRTRLKRIAIWSGATLAALAVGAFLFMLSGVYNVAASRGHFAVTEWLLEIAMRRSVATHSYWIAAPPLQDAEMIRLGAGHFEGGCAPCHGAPGKESNPVVRRMLPPPPDLAEAAPTWSSEELFWIVKNGLKYTGMPAWVAPQRDDEVWSIVAFLRQLPGMDAERYRALATGNAGHLIRTPGELPNFGSGSTSLTVCARCHEDETHAPLSSLVPRLAGQSARYLEAALADYASGMRSSGFMQPVAAELETAAIRRLAEYYAGLPAGARPGAAKAPPAQIERGERIATVGTAPTGTPPCLACHAAGSAEIFPRLAGQHARYVAGQLRLWRAGQRNRTARGAIMAAIATRLTEQQIDDVAAYFENLRPAAGGAPSRAASPTAAPGNSP
jgi:cytochrome c553